MPVPGTSLVAPELAAIQPSDVFWAVVVAFAVWVVGWLLIAAISRRPTPGRPEVPEEELPSHVENLRPIVRTAEPLRQGSEVEPPSLAETLRVTPQSAGIGGVLRWLLSETEAEAAAFLRLSPGGGEHFVVEPRGLSGSAVGDLARAGREALIGGDPHGPRGVVSARWLGSGGSKVLVLRGVTSVPTEEPLRFARFAIEWVGSPHEELAAMSIEERVRSVPGVAWAEMNGSDRKEIRVLPTENVERSMVEESVEKLVAGSGFNLSWVDPSAPPPEIRARLLEIEMDENGQSAASVHLDWRGQELRGRGYGAQSDMGRCQAAAQAVADALGPLIAGEVHVDSVSTQPLGGSEVVTAVVTVDGQRFVGAVEMAGQESGASGARAVLDALNRRLSLIAGGSGRI